MSAKDGGAAHPICKNCGLGPNDHMWVTRHCQNGITYEEYNVVADAMLAEDAEREGK
jgi:hypothetical protein